MNEITWNPNSILDVDGNVASTVDIFRTDASKPFDKDNLYNPVATVNNNLGEYVDNDYMKTKKFRYVIVNSGRFTYQNSDDPFGFNIETTTTLQPTYKIYF